PAAHQPEELIHLERRDPNISCNPAHSFEHLDIVPRSTQAQLGEYLLDVHVRLAEIGKAYPFEKVTSQRESYSIYLPGDLGSDLNATLFGHVEWLDPCVESLCIRELSEKGSARGDRPAET